MSDSRHIRLKRLIAEILRDASAVEDVTWLHIALLLAYNKRCLDSQHLQGVEVHSIIERIAGRHRGVPGQTSHEEGCQV